MAKLYAPSEKGFNNGLETLDRCQVGLLRELSAQLGNRLALKGDMAMRAAFGSMRLTKDIDFDSDQTFSHDTLKKILERMLVRAAGSAGIRAPKAQITKDTRSTVRARLAGIIGDKTDALFDIEVSHRLTPAAENVRVEIVTPPAKYSMAPFPVTTYTNAALAAMKIGAALSDQRNAPRDLYDLRDLIWAGADPSELLARQDADLLSDFADRALGKLELLTFQLAQQELLPYLPPEDREALDEERWIDATLMVAGTIQGWCKSALQLQQAREKAREKPREKQS